MNATQIALAHNTKTWAFTIRQNAACKCGVARSRMIAVTAKRTVNLNTGRVILSSSRRVGEIDLTCACGRRLSFRDVKGSYVADKKCDARCVNSKGHICECSCGGKNHGAGYGG